MYATIRDDSSNVPNSDKNVNNGMTVVDVDLEDVPQLKIATITNSNLDQSTHMYSRLDHLDLKANHDKSKVDSPCSRSMKAQDNQRVHGEAEYDEPDVPRHLVLHVGSTRKETVIEYDEPDALDICKYKSESTDLSNEVTAASHESSAPKVKCEGDLHQLETATNPPKDSPNSDQSKQMHSGLNQLHSKSNQDKSMLDFPSSRKETTQQISSNQHKGNFSKAEYNEPYAQSKQTSNQQILTENFSGEEYDETYDQSKQIGHQQSLIGNFPEAEYDEPYARCKKLTLNDDTDIPRKKENDALTQLEHKYDEPDLPVKCTAKPKSQIDSENSTAHEYTVLEDGKKQEQQYINTSNTATWKSDSAKDEYSILQGETTELLGSCQGNSYSKLNWEEKIEVKLPDCDYTEKQLPSTMNQESPRHSFNNTDGVDTVSECSPQKVGSTEETFEEYEEKKDSPTEESQPVHLQHL